MKPKAIFAGIFLSIIFVHCSNMKQDDFPVLQGPYLDQKPPGKIPELFAPGVVTSPFDEAYPSFTKDGKEFYFHCHNKGGWFFTDRKRGIWSQPQIVPFSKESNHSRTQNSPSSGKHLEQN